MTPPAGAGVTLIRRGAHAAAMLARWGLAGLLGFEAILAVYTFSNGATEHGLMALAAATALGWAILGHAREGRVPRLALGLLVAVTLLRALRQTAFAGVWPPGVMPTYLVPLGFALLLWPRVHPGVGIALVALARSWFILWYFQAGATPLAVANLVGALGAWAWLAGETVAARPLAEDEAGAARQ